ncbi:MAG: PKD domain-containing protein, partial [Thermoplasmatota archaeon]
LQINVSNIAPKAELYSTKRSSYKDESVRFDASRSTDTESDLETLRYHWDMGDGTKSYGGPVIDHTYTTSGTMRVVLTVIDDDSDTDTEEINFVVNNAPPLVYIDAPDEVEVGEWFWVDASATTDTISDISNLQFTYDMGEGTSAVVTSENKLNHTYSSPGLYTIRLTVTDGDSETTEEHIIKVVEPPKIPEESSNAGVVIAGVVFGVVIILLLAVVAFIFISKRRQQPPPPPPGMPPAIPPRTPPPGLYAKPAQGLPPPGPPQPPSGLPPPPVHP